MSGGPMTDPEETASPPGPSGNGPDGPPLARSAPETAATEPEAAPGGSRPASGHLIPASGTSPAQPAQAVPAQPGPPIPDMGGEVEPTGDERVDAVLGRLRELGGVPVAGHVEIFEDVHRRLQDVLTSVDQEAAVPRQPGPGIVPARPGGLP